MKLSSLLDSRFIFFDADVASQDEAVRFMVDKIYKEYSFELDKALLIEKLAERERQGHTLLDGGLSIPHARLENFEDYIIGVCVLRHPFMMEGKEIKMVIMLLVDHTAPALHLKTLGAIASLVKKQDVFENLLQVENAQTFIKLIEDTNLKVERELTVADIMSKNIVQVSPETSLKEVVNLMEEHRASYLPVVDSNGNVLGEITVLEILKKGLPDYVRNLEHLHFLTSLSSFENLLKNEEKIQASEVMRDVQHRLPMNTPVVEAALMMVQNYKRHILIEDKGKMVGVVSYMDMLSKVLRG